MRNLLQGAMVALLVGLAGGSSHPRTRPARRRKSLPREVMSVWRRGRGAALPGHRYPFTVSGMRSLHDRASTTKWSDER